MGLDVSHDAFCGAYSAFNRFRQAICKVMGGSFPPHDPEFVRRLEEQIEPESSYWGDGFSPETHPGLEILISHSDCDGVISPSDCVLVAKDLSSLLPEIDKLGGGSGHISARGGYGGVTRKFIAGCESAAAAGEDLEFH